MWYLAAVTACPVHNCLLLDECPSCKKPIRWNRAKVCVCSCGYDLREARSTELDGEEIAFTDQIYRLCGLKKEEKSAIEQLAAANPLYKLDLQYLLRTVFFMAGQLHGINDTKGKKLAPSLKNDKLHELLTKAFSVFEKWPGQFQQFLTDRIKQNENYDSRTGLIKDFGGFYTVLYRRLKDRQFDFMRSAFEEFLVEQWKGGYCGNFRTAYKRSSRYESRKETAHLLNISLPSVPRLVKKGLLEGLIRKMGSRELCLVDVESINRLKKRYNKALTVKETAEMLGISEKHVTNLAKSGCLEALRGPIIDGCAIWKFEREAIDKLLNRIKQTIVSDSDVPASEMVDFHKAIHKLSLLSLKLENFVQVILERKIMPYGIGSKQGFAGLLFSKKEIRDYLNDGLTKKRKGMLSVCKAADVLGVQSYVLYVLIKKKFIEVERVTLYGAGQTVMVGQEAIEKFKATYTFSNHIAITYHISPHHLLFLIMDQGIMPVSGPLIDGGRLYVFKTADIESLDIAKLISEEKTAKIGNMKESKLLTTEEAAKLLCLGKKEILKFIRRGALNPSFPPNSKLKNSTRLYFTLFDVEKFKKRYIDAPGVLSAGEAATMLK
jgi:predicted DNA-binding transcriptional regulator AlpA